MIWLRVISLFFLIVSGLSVVLNGFRGNYIPAKTLVVVGLAFVIFVCSMGWLN